MRNILFTLLMFILLSEPKISSSQTYHPFPDALAQWSEYSSYCWDINPWAICYSNGYLFSLANDSVIEGMSYVLIGFDSTWEQKYQLSTGPISAINFNYQLPGTIIGALRTDSTKKVWFRKMNDAIPFGWGASEYFSIDSDVLLYDFNVQIGDSLTWKPFNLMVSQIDSVQLANSEYRRRITLSSDGMYEPESWIEGVGSAFGLFGSYAHPPFEAVYYLSCFRQNDSLLIGINSYDCDHIFTGIADPIEKIIPIVFPNPAGDFLTFDLIKFSGLKADITLYNSNGKQVKRYSEILASELKIPVSEIGAGGLYFYTIGLKGKKMVTGKFLILQ